MRIQPRDLKPLPQLFAHLIDGPGHGASGDSGKPYTMRDCAAAAVDVAITAQRLLVEAAVRGPRLGNIETRLEAGMRDAWTLNRQAAWSGSLRTDTPDLAWLADCGLTPASLRATIENV